MLIRWGKLMGAQLWHHQASWNASPLAALKELQAQFVTTNYDLATLLPKELADARESLKAAKEDGDPYDLCGIYQARVELLERLCSRPIPEDAEPRVQILRQINAATGDSVGNVLDVSGISKKREELSAQRLDDSEIEHFTGANCPTLARARESVDKINEELGRGEAVCFPFYENDTPAGWYFVGNTGD
jgi:hypothetical protein